MSNDIGPVANEIGQTRPFRSTSQEAVVGLLRTVDLLRRHLGRFVEAHGITLQQYNVLRILRGAGPKGLPTLELAHRMLEQTPGVTRMIDRLEEKQLVDRVRCVEDRRIVYCRLTGRARGLVDRLDGPMNEADEVLAMLGEADQRKLIALLDAIRSTLKETVGGASARARPKEGQDVQDVDDHQ
jgi:DNA-binding MarR family transcriptional regulator